MLPMPLLPLPGLASLQPFSPRFDELRKHFNHLFTSIIRASVHHFSSYITIYRSEVMALAMGLSREQRADISSSPYAQKYLWSLMPFAITLMVGDGVGRMRRCDPLSHYGRELDDA